jgi:hypothetical protein
MGEVGCVEKRQRVGGLIRLIYASLDECRDKARPNIKHWGRVVTRDL